MKRLTRRRRTTFALGACIAGLLLCAPGAFAATVTVDATGNLVYAAAAGHHNGISFQQTASSTVVLHELTHDGYPDGSNYGNSPNFFHDDDPITPDGTACTDTGPDADGNPTFTCTGVTGQVVATGLDLQDGFDAGGLAVPGVGGLTTLAANFDGGDGSDTLVGGRAGDVMHGGAGDDTLFGDSVGGGPGGNDKLFGDAGNDFIGAGPGDDTVSGGDGADEVSGGPGNDSVAGDAGDDIVQGGPGNDTVDGGAGDDQLDGGCSLLNGGCGLPDGTDTIIGGPGTDTVTMTQTTTPPPGTVFNVSLDDQANDGFSSPPQNSNVHSDVENVNVVGSTGGTISGSAAMNVINASNGNDTIDAGAGNDFVNANGGDDVVNAVDGYADFISCGPGNDTANVDQFDTTQNCETVNVTQLGSLATEDHPPTVSWVAPADKATLSSKSPTTLQVNASDDKGVTQVVFMVGERVLCTVKAAPYTCSYQPQDVDLGNDTLTAIAYDTSQQTASAVRTVVVPRFQPGIRARTTPRRDTKAPYHFTTSGNLILPKGATAAHSCTTGQVAVQIKAGKKTISNRRVNITKSCTFRSSVTFSLPHRLNPRVLRVFVSWRGNGFLAPVEFPTYALTVRL